MIALIDSARAPSSHYDSKQHEDILARLEALTFSPTQFQAQLAIVVNLNSQSEDLCFAITLPCGG